MLNLIILLIVFLSIGVFCTNCISANAETRCALAGVQVTEMIIETWNGVEKSHITCNLPKSLK